MRRLTALSRAPLLAAALIAATPAAAHGLLVTATAEGSVVVGRVYYSDGAPGVREFVELRDLTDPARAAASAQTDGRGAFRLPGTPGHAYAVIAHGEEGHTTEVRLTLAPGESARLAGEPEAPRDPFPAWAVIGALLAASALAALWLRKR